jgi:pimeloyl-ACP methyl ester carboxylesterase
MIEWAGGYVNSNGLQIHYYRTGGDKPQVVINHSAGDDGLCWTHVVKELEKDYDVILPDARGHAKSASGKNLKHGNEIENSYLIAKIVLKILH